MLKRILEKYIGQLLILLTVTSAVTFGYHLWRNANEARLHEELIGTKEKYEQLTKYTAKLETDYKKQEDLHEAAKKTWSEVVKDKDERIKLLSDATYLISKHVSKQDGPDYYFETPGRTRNYVLNEVRIAGNDSPPLGYVLIKYDGRTYKRNYEFEIQVKNLQTVDEKTGKVKVYAKAYLVLKENGLAGKRRKDFKEWKDILYELPIVGGVALVDPTTPAFTEKFYLWAPHINGGLNLGADTAGGFIRPELNFSVAGYGKTKNDLSWKFMQLGVSVDTDFKNPDLHIIPFTYRPLPGILSNTYIGPGIGWSTRGMNLFGNISLSF